MANERISILLNDLLPTAQLDASPAAVSTLPVTFLTHPSRSEAMLVEGDNVTITATFQTPKNLSCAVLCRHNLTSAATATLELLGENDAILGTFNPAVKPSIVAYFPMISVHKIRWVLTDTGAAEIRVGRGFAGEVWQPTFNVDRGAGLGFEDSSEQVRAQSGTIFFKTRAKFPKNTLHFSNLFLEEMLILRGINTGKGLFMSIYRDWETALESEFEGVYAFMATPEITHEDAYTFVGNATILEA